MKSLFFYMMATIVLFGGGVSADQPTVAEVTHWQLQAVDQQGIATYSPADSDKVIVKGIVLNNPEEMLDPAPSQGGMGGQWQIFIQGEANDHAGTAVWMGQNYSDVSSSDDYTHEQLLAEFCRINRDPNTGYIFTAGDRVKVTGWYKVYRGKTNINEKHESDPFWDFKVELLEPAVGLPAPEVITIDTVKDNNDNWIFDPNRTRGAEYYQARRIRINDVNILNPENWAPYNTVEIMDSNGLTMPVKLGIGEGFSRYPCPQGRIDVIGIFNQEAPGTPPHGDSTKGYRLWVVNYDGNGLVLTDRGYERGNMHADVNRDFAVDLKDFAEIADRWLEYAPGLRYCE